MQDAPTTNEILEVVAAFLRDEILPQMKGSAAFQTRVAANALDLVRREAARPADESGAERQRLALLLGHDGTLADLTTELADRLRAGTFDPDTPGLMDHLWQTTCAKLAVDQPRYAGYLKALERDAQNNKKDD